MQSLWRHKFSMKCSITLMLWRGCIFFFLIWIFWSNYNLDLYSYGQNLFLYSDVVFLIYFSIIFFKLLTETKRYKFDWKIIIKLRNVWLYDLNRFKTCWINSHLRLIMASIKTRLIQLMEQKGMTFDNDFCYFIFLFSSLFF